MSKRDHRIETVADMLDLSPEEFRRMLPDLCLWYATMREVHGMPGVTNTGFLWTDDGENVITEAHLHDPQTGKVTVAKL